MCEHCYHEPCCLHVPRLRRVHLPDETAAYVWEAMVPSPVAKTVGAVPSADGGADRTELRRHSPPSIEAVDEAPLVSAPLATG